MLHGMFCDFLSYVLLGLTCMAPGKTVPFTRPLGELRCPGSFWAAPRAGVTTWWGRPLAVQPVLHARRPGWCRSSSGPRALTGDCCVVETPGLPWAHHTAQGPCWPVARGPREPGAFLEPLPLQHAGRDSCCCCGHQGASSSGLRSQGRHRCGRLARGGWSRLSPPLCPLRVLLSVSDQYSHGRTPATCPPTWPRVRAPHRTLRVLQAPSSHPPGPCPSHRPSPVGWCLGLLHPQTRQLVLLGLSPARLLLA